MYIAMIHGNEIYVGLCRFLIKSESWDFSVVFNIFGDCLKMCAYFGLH